MRLNLSSFDIKPFIPFLLEAINHPDGVISIGIAKLLKRTSPDLTHYILYQLNQALQDQPIIYLAEMLLNDSQKNSEPKGLEIPRIVTFQETNLDVFEDDIKMDFQLFIAQMIKEIECLDDSVRENAVYALSHVNSESFIKNMFNVQSDQHIQEILQQVVRELSKAIQDSNYNIRRIAAYSLEKIGNPQALSALWQQKIKFPDEEIDKAILSIKKQCEFYNYEITQSDPPPAVQPLTSQIQTGVTMNFYKDVHGVAGIVQGNQITYLPPPDSDEGDEAT